jgi:hypothetical protein
MCDGPQMRMDTYKCVRRVHGHVKECECVYVYEGVHGCVNTYKKCVDE